MIKAILTSLFAVSLFAGGAVGAWYIMNLEKEKEAALAGEFPNDPSAASTAPTVQSGGKSGESANLAEFTTPVLGKALNGEDIFRFTAMNKKNLELMKERRESLRQEEMRLKLAEQDLDVRKQEIEGVLRQSQETVAAAEALISKLQAELNVLREEKAEAEASDAATGTPNVTEDEIQANVKISAGWLAMMPAEKAAESIKSLANAGKKDLVLQLFSFIEDRDVAKILNELNDATLVAELTESFRTAKRPIKKRK